MTSIPDKFSISSCTSLSLDGLRYKVLDEYQRKIYKIRSSGFLFRFFEAADPKKEIFRVEAERRGSWSWKNILKEPDYLIKTSGWELLGKVKLCKSRTWRIEDSLGSALAEIRYEKFFWKALTFQYCVYLPNNEIIGLLKQRLFYPYVFVDLSGDRQRKLDRQIALGFAGVFIGRNYGE